MNSEKKEIKILKMPKLTMFGMMSCALENFKSRNLEKQEDGTYIKKRNTDFLSKCMNK